MQGSGAAWLGSMAALAVAVALCVGLGATQTAFAQSAAEPLLRRHEALSRVLRRPASVRRERRLVRMLDDAIDYRMLVRRVLVVHWEDMSDGQRTEALSLLTAAIRHRYRASLAALDGWSVEVRSESARGVGRRVETVAVRGGERRAIGYDLYARDGEWRVVDLVVDGESLIHEYRSQFDRVVRREGVDGLIGRLRTRVAEDEAPGSP